LVIAEITFGVADGRPLTFCATGAIRRFAPPLREALAGERFTALGKCGSLFAFSDVTTEPAPSLLMRCEDKRFSDHPFSSRRSGRERNQEKNRTCYSTPGRDHDYDE